MRTSVLTGLKKGKWEMIAGPDIPVNVQKQEFKRLRSSKSDYAEIQIHIGAANKYRHGSEKQTFVPAIVDDLTQLAEEGLKKVIAKEGLKVKFDVNHEATRAAIRKARESAKAK